MIMSYTRVNWQNAPSTATPVNAENLNIMDKGIADAHSQLAEIASDKADVTYVNKQLNFKRDKETKIKGTDLETATDSDKIQLVNLSEEVQNAMAGTAPVISSVADGSLTSTKYAAKSVTSSARTNIGEMGMILSFGTPNFDFVNMTLTIPSKAWILHRKKLYPIADGADLIIDLSVISSYFGSIYFNTSTSTFIVRNNDVTPSLLQMTEDEILVATFYKTTKAVNMIGDHLVDGKSTDLPFNQYLNVERTWVYTLGNKNITVENTTVGIGKVYLKFDTLLVVGFNGGAWTDVHWSQVHADLEGIATFETSSKGVADCLVIPSGYMLVFDIITNKVNLFNRTMYYPERHIMLLNSANGVAVGGDILTTKTLYDVSVLQESVEELLQEAPIIPGQLNQSYQDEIINIKTSMVKVDNGNFNYIAITDLHNWSSLDNSPLFRQLESVVNIANSMDIDFVGVLGDLIEIEDTKELAIEKMLEITEILSKCNKPVIFSYGNHDFNSYNLINNVPLSKIVTPSEYYNICVSPFNNDNEGKKLYFYKDFDNKKIRVINLQYSDITINDNGDNTCNIVGNLSYQVAQIKWLSETLKNTPDDFKIIILSHGTFIDEANLHYSSDNKSIAIVGLINAFNDRTTYNNPSFDINVDYSANLAKVIINNYGHIHVDLLAKSSEADDIVLISTGTSSSIVGGTGPSEFENYTTLPYTRADKTFDGTVNEALFDIISVSETEVKRIRFGVGEDAVVSL